MTIIFSTRGNHNNQPQKEIKSRIFSTSKTPTAIGPYSKAYKAGDFLFCSGQIGLNPETMDIVGGGIEEETKQACRNLLNLLMEYSLSLKDVVKTTIYLKNISDFEIVNDTYKNYFVIKPARTVVGVSSLPKGALIEIEAIAMKQETEEQIITERAFPEI